MPSMMTPAMLALIALPTLASCASRRIARRHHLPSIRRAGGMQAALRALKAFGLFHSG